MILIVYNLSLKTGDIIKKIDVSALVKNFPPINPLTAVSLDSFLRVFEKVLQHVQETPGEMVLEKEVHYVGHYMEDIMARLETFNGLSFTSLFAKGDSRVKIVTIFLAILELCKGNKIKFEQNKNFDDVWIYAQHSLGGE